MKEAVEIRNILKQFHLISGFRISIHDAEKNEIAAYPHSLHPLCLLLQEDKEFQKRCLDCDRYACEVARRTGKVYLYRCHGGLSEAVSPIYHYGVLSGYLMMGQVGEGGPIDAMKLKESLESRIPDAEALSEAIRSLPFIPKDKILSYLDIMHLIAEYITETNRLSLEKKQLAELTREYIAKHLSEKIELHSLCEHFAVSKSTLTARFREKYGQSVMDCVTKLRFQKACTLLCDTEQSIKTIALAVGYHDQNYFSRAFTKEFGVSPLVYRGVKKGYTYII